MECPCNPAKLITRVQIPVITTLLSPFSVKGFVLGFQREGWRGGGVEGGGVNRQGTL